MMSLFFIPYFFPLHYSPFAFKEPARKRKIRGEQNKKIPNAKAFGILSLRDEIDTLSIHRRHATIMLDCGNKITA